MEKLSFTKELNEVKQKEICVNQLITDRHTGIRKYMREQESKIIRQFDVWQKRLDKVGQNKSCEMDKIYIKSFLVGLRNLQKGRRIVA